MKTLLAIVGVLALMFVAMLWSFNLGLEAGTDNTWNTLFYILPECQEDAILLGDGEFISGRWTQYFCGPSVDDLQLKESNYDNPS